MKNKKFIFVILNFIFLIGCSCLSEKQSLNEISFSNNTKEKKVDVLVNGNLFTSYIYNDEISVLKKTVLFPLISANGVAITRGFPLDPKPSERVDHPHHIGAWFNYGDVNGLDYWNNSDAISEDKKKEMGTIRHDEILDMENGNGKGELVVSTNWLKPNGEILLKEKTNFTFMANNDSRIIDREVTLTAQNEPVLFKDNKEGMIAIRVARQLEHPSKDPVTLSDAHGKKTDVPVLDNTGVTGHYISSEGIEGDDVWSTRARWVSLDGTIDGKDVKVVIFDNPENVGFPTYWHARGYGLFAANPLGQNIFSNGKETLNFNLEAGKSVTFKYRILIQNGKLSKDKIEECFNKFSKNN
ncbi:MAG: PmoA family protein [Ignavibacteriae bacterium]|nr:PmoA family protein [Ignavibacteriota bacterium]